MNELELRALVRESVARHIGRGAAGEPAPRPAAGPAASPWRAHASHALHLAVVNADDACVIEPAVRCDHCGYCKSHGH